jgi:hypothetical protein
MRFIHDVTKNSQFLIAINKNGRRVQLEIDDIVITMPYSVFKSLVDVLQKGIDQTKAEDPVPEPFRRAFDE